MKLNHFQQSIQHCLNQPSTFHLSMETRCGQCWSVVKPWPHDMPWPNTQSGTNMKERLIYLQGLINKCHDIPVSTDINEGRIPALYNIIAAIAIASWYDIHGNNGVTNFGGNEELQTIAREIRRQCNVEIGKCLAKSAN